MSTDTNIVIRPVKNGFILEAEPNSRFLEPSTHVFQTFAELVGFLGMHFTHRQQAVLKDTVTVAKENES